MDIQTFERVLRNPKASKEAVSGVCGRIIRGRVPGDFETMTDDPSRKLVMLMGADGLAKLPGLSGYEMLVEIGYEASYIERKVTEGNQFKLVVFPEGGPAKLATWGNVIAVVSSVYPDIASKLQRNAKELASVSFDEIERRAGFDFSEVDKAGPADPRYMTHERFAARSGTLVDVRAFLYFTVHLRELFTGDGYTKTTDGRRGMMEYIAPNARLSDLGEHALITLTVTLPRLPVSHTGGAMTTRQQLQTPSFFDGGNASHWSYRPDLTHLFDESQAWKGRYGVKPSALDRFKLHLLLIDVQKDFCYPEGTLYVGGRNGKGAIEDNVRIAEFIYRELPRISEITTTFDTHFAYQIFFPWFWVDRDGKPLSQHTMIRIHDNGRRLVNILPDGTVLKDDVKPNPAITNWVCEGNYTWLEKQAFFYCQELAKGGKYTLYLWPPHCILGSDGHALSGVVHEARQFHSFVRGNQSWGEVKGTHPLTENYSVLSPEVLMRWDGKPLAQKNARFIKTLLSEGAVVIAGQAASHCVRSSIDDLLGEILAKDPELAKKVYIMQDCMSSVVVPDGKGGFIADFTPQAEEALAKFQAAGMHVVDSTTPVESWPEIKKLAA